MVVTGLLVGKDGRQGGASAIEELPRKKAVEYMAGIGSNKEWIVSIYSKMNESIKQCWEEEGRMRFKAWYNLYADLKSIYKSPTYFYMENIYKNSMKIINKTLM